MKKSHKNTSAVFYAGKVNTLEMITQIKNRLHRLEVTKMKKLSLTLMLILGLVVSCQFSVVSNAYADIPHLISYQGRLTDTEGAPVADGTYSVTFRIYASEAGGSALWTETHSATASDGIFEVLMGSNTSLDLPFDAQYYLGIQIDSDPEMTPRQKLASSGYAYRAEEADHAIDADSVGGIEASTTPEANKLIALNADGKLPEEVLYSDYTAGEHLLAAADKQFGPHAPGYPVKFKEIVIPRAGTLKIEFEMTSSHDNVCRAQVYRNDVTVGTLRYATSQWTKYSEVISGWQAGDKVQLWGGHFGGANISVRNFRIYTSSALTAPIVTLDMGN